LKFLVLGRHMGSPVPVPFSVQRGRDNFREVSYRDGK
jgi:hypothetical protein